MELAIEASHQTGRRRIDDALRIERATFAAKLRASRAVLGISQEQLARTIGLTQKSIHRIEQGAVQPKMRTVLTIQKFWGDSGIAFENSLLL